MIDVIIPVYNKEENIRTCLESVENQTLKGLNIIIIDDASTDDSYAILKEYQKKYENITLIHNQNNLGQGKSRNLGLNISTSEYVGFVDADDYINTDMYKRLYNLSLLNDKPDIISTGIRFVKDNYFANKDLSYASSNYYRKISKNEIDVAIKNQSPSVCNKIFKRSFIKDYRFLENTQWEDIAFTTYLYLQASSIVETNNSDYFYRRLINNSVSSKNYHPNKNITDIFTVTDKIIADLKANDLYYSHQKVITEICLSKCLLRLDELELWQIPDNKKLSIKNQLFSLIFNKYGPLNDSSMEYIQTIITDKTIEEYRTFTKPNNKLLKKC